jgi:hypothetical protein
MIRYDYPPTQSQARIRQRVAALESLQAKRITYVAQQKKDLDAVIEKEQRRIDNLKQQLTMEVVK